MNIYEEIQKIQPLDEKWAEACKKHWDNITKPLDSLGLLERAIIQMGAITERENVRLDKKAVIAMCADNGVVAEGVTQTDNSVTAIVAENMAAGIANVNVMAKYSATDVFTVDIGVAADLRHPNIINRKIARGTANFTQAPAMSKTQAEQAISVGIELVSELKAQGYDIIALGEMGIGNTTTSSALAAVFLSKPAAEVTGPGAGLSQAGIQRKIAAIEKAIALHRPDPNQPLQTLAQLGGFDIAGLVGVIIGCAVHRLPVLLDGFISYVAALTAIRLAPAAKPYIMASHISKEPAGQMLVDALGLQPIIHAEMSLGEGTGAVAVLPLFEMALAIYNQNHTFADSNITAYQHFDKQ